jgi:hypothetical protein
LNVNATSSYDLRKLEIEKRALLNEKELLMFEVAKLESLNNLKVR